MLIAGQGAAGFAAALYSARYQMRTIVLGETFGGETATGGNIENYPGFPEIDGFELMMKFREQVEGYDVPVVAENVVSVEYDGHLFRSTTSEGNVFTSTAVVLAVGRERRKLGLEHEEEWTGRGVLLLLYVRRTPSPRQRRRRGGRRQRRGRGRDPARQVRGGRSTSSIAADSFARPEPVTLRLPGRSGQRSPSVQHERHRAQGHGRAGRASLLDRPVDGATELALDGLFIEIGADPRVEVPNQLGLELNEVNEVIVDKTMRTKRRRRLGRRRPDRCVRAT